MTDPDVPAFDSVSSASMPPAGGQSATGKRSWRRGSVVESDAKSNCCTYVSGGRPASVSSGSQSENVPVGIFVTNVTWSLPVSRPVENAADMKLYPGSNGGFGAVMAN